MLLKSTFPWKICIILASQGKAYFKEYLLRVRRVVSTSSVPLAASFHHNFQMVLSTRLS